MELQALHNQLVVNNLRPYYVFTGQEVGILDIYIQRIAETSHTTIRRPDSLISIYSKLSNKTIMDKPNCFVIKEDKDFMQQEKIWDRLIKRQVQGDHILIFVYNEIDKRSKFYKHHAEMIVSFDRMLPETLARYIKRDIGLDIKSAIEFASACDCDYCRIKLEEDKLTHLSKIEGITIEEAYQKAKDDELIYTTPRDLIFELIDAVCTKKRNRSYDLWIELKEKGENPLAILSLLYNNFKSILLVQSLGSSPDIAEKTGLSAWQIKMAREKMNHYVIPDLIENLRIIRGVEKGIKTGLIEQDLAIDYTLGEVLL